MTRTSLHAQYKNRQSQYALLTTNQERRAFCRSNAITLSAIKGCELDSVFHGLPPKNVLKAVWHLAFCRENEQRTNVVNALCH